MNKEDRNSTRYRNFHKVKEKRKILTVKTPLRIANCFKIFVISMELFSTRERTVEVKFLKKVE